MRWALLLLLAAACDSGQAGFSTGKVAVVATTGMVADLAIVIGGPMVEVKALMGPGVDPHLYMASAGDLDRLRAADLILYSGKGLEGKLGDIFGKMARKRPVYAVTEDIPHTRLLELPRLVGHFDPHVWFDVALWSEATRVVAKALSAVDPAHLEDYERRATDYRKRLLALHEEVGKQIATIPKGRRVLVTSHDAFRYMGRAYNLEVRGLQGVSTVSDPGVKDVQDMVDMIVRRKIKAIFVESSVSPKAIQAVQAHCRSRGHEVTIGGELFSDAMGDEPPEDTYVGMVRANVRTIVNALK